MTAPVLLVYGARDERVPPDASAQAIQAALAAAGNHDVTLRIYPDADHRHDPLAPGRLAPAHAELCRRLDPLGARAQVKERPSVA